MCEVVAVVSDFIFRSKIASTAESLGLKAIIVGSVGEFERATAGDPPRLVLVDLEEGIAAVRQIIETCSLLSPKPTIVGYCPHVRKDVMDEARAAGVDRVMPRSSFAANLPAVLGGQAD